MKEHANSMTLKKLPRLQPRSGLKVMLASIRALLFREVQTRFGRYRLGYFWVFLEPMLSIGIMVLIFGTIRERVAPGIDFVVFLVNGIIPFFMFRTGVKQSMGAVQANKGLFSYKPVKPIDAVIARNFLELILKFIAYSSFSAALIWFGYHISFESIPQIIGYWGLLFLFMFACSLVFMVIADFSQEIQKFLSVVFILLYLLSGIIYSIHIIPPQYREYLLWNPLIHIFENMRHAVSPTYALVPGISLTYFMEWLIGTLFIGLLLYKRFEKRMVSSK
ncbi:polysialic acid transporter [Acinetobacter sp. ANC 4558]|uniref:ABC transporter permease n=1 Tax=Acinetobacter sp. ANC 4558 TaxID=1977876 RepID=UPI000A35AC6F|nr:ABC transporter permease [Acinetobacter sp. ANC 4558]OTG86716.1 polysialic acid transporter [Acinetobacter sp. ANC 4558]